MSAAAAIDAMTPNPQQEGEGTESVVPASFLPVDLVPVLAGHVLRPEPSILRRDDRHGLFYAGQVNGVHGDSGTGKGWIVLTACVQQITAGRHVVFVDLEDVPESIVSRLRLLGAADDGIVERFHYVRPTDPFGFFAVTSLVELVRDTQASLLVVDSLGEAFGLDGINEDKDNEVGPWLRAVARPLADAGAAVVLVDHSTKATDNPLHPSGSKRKRAAIGGASYLVTSPSPLTAEGGGRLRLTCAKDRHGAFRRGQVVGTWVMTVDPIIGTSWALYAPSDDETGPAVLPAELACRAALRALEVEGAPMSLRALRATMTIKASNEIKTAGIDLAASRGEIVEGAGPRNARMFSLPTRAEP